VGGANDPIDPETSSITKLKETLEELERWQAAFESGEVDDPPDQQLLAQIRTILNRRKKRQITRQLRTDGGGKK
jgi:hypothetical protein